MHSLTTKPRLAPTRHLASERRQHGGLLGALAAIMIVVALLALLANKGGGSKSTTPEDPTSGLRYACKEFLSRALHDPATAEWGEIASWTVVDNHDGTFSVGASYRAKNGFGAMRMAYTTCIIRKESTGDFRLVKLSQMK